MNTAALLPLGLAAALAAATMACARYDDGDTHTLRLPSRDGFTPVSSVLEQRCGSLDCHGAPARNLRVYGVYGLRADGNSVTGNPDTTEQEVDATYESVLSVDPEMLGRVLAGTVDASEWIVLSKGTGREAHTGGARLPPGGSAHRCVVAWATGDEDAPACERDVFGPEPRDGETW